MEELNNLNNFIYSNIHIYGCVCVSEIILFHDRKQNVKISSLSRDNLFNYRSY